MADIDFRVRVLTDLLMNRGFGWLAIEIIQAIEDRGDSLVDRDPNVAAQREDLNARLLRGDAKAVLSPEVVKEAATRSEAQRDRLEAHDQISLAVEILVDRLSSAAEMTALSVDELTNLVDGSVSVSVEVDKEIRHVFPAKARETAAQLRGIKDQLREWLNTTSPSSTT